MREGEPEHAPTQSVTSIASSQNCGPKARPRLVIRKPTAAMATQGKKANSSRLIAACTAGNSIQRVTGTSKRRDELERERPGKARPGAPALGLQGFSSTSRRMTEMAESAAATPVSFATSASA